MWSKTARLEGKVGNLLKVVTNKSTGKLVPKGEARHQLKEVVDGRYYPPVKTALKLIYYLI